MEAKKLQDFCGNISGLFLFITRIKVVFTKYSTYVDKQCNSYINDINSGVYQKNGLSLVQFDLSSIYNIQKFTDTNDLFCVCL